MDLRAVQRGRRIGEMPDARRDAGLLHTVGERVEVRDLTVGGFHEFRNVRAVGHGEMAPLADNLDHPLLGQRHQLVKRRTEPFRRETVTTETGIDLHVHAGDLTHLACGRGHGVDARQRADRHVDVVIDELIERHRGAVVHPCENMATIRADAKLAQQQGLMGLRGAQPRGTSRQSGERRRQQTMPVRIRLDHAHHGRT